MSRLNYNHLRYFREVARAGGIAPASESLHLTPQTISGQISAFEAVLGYQLFARVGRRLELNDAGRTVLGYADEIFSLGNELEGVLRDPSLGRPRQLRVGIADAVPKVVAYRMLEPAMQSAQSLRIECREGKLRDLLAELAVHRIDIVIADSPIPPSVNVKGFSHSLGESDVTFFASRGLARCLKGEFPQSLDGAPLLLPGEDAAVRPRLIRWLEERDIHPRIVGEFDDGALLKAFGRAGAGVFPAATAIAGQVQEQYEVIALGRAAEVTESFFAISVERRLSHPAVVALTSAARNVLFRKSRRKGGKPV